MTVNFLKFNTALTFLSFTVIGQADPLDTWTWCYPIPGYGNGHFVAVGGQWMILQSGSIINLSITPNNDTGSLTLSFEGPTGVATANSWP